jgi:hypothetical protein
MEMKIMEEAINEEKRLIEKAKMYTGGDEKKAREMVYGTLQDIFVLKIMFKSDEQRVYGLIEIFVNNERKALHNYFTVATKTTQIIDNANSISWSDALKSLIVAIYSKENDMNTTSKIKNAIERELTPTLVATLCEKMFSNDRMSINAQFEKMVSFALRAHDTSMEFTLEKSSSLVVDQTISEGKYLVDQMNKEEQEKNAMEKAAKEAESPADTAVSRLDKQVIDEGNRLIGCKLVLSPVKGKYVSQLVPEDVVKVRINDPSPASVKIAEKLGVYFEGRMKPIECKIHSVIKVDAGNVIYVNIAPNLVGKILEEEEVRVYVDEKTLAKSSPANQGKGGGKSLLVWVIILLLIIGMVVLYFAMAGS